MGADEQNDKRSATIDIRTLFGKIIGLHFTTTRAQASHNIFTAYEETGNGSFAITRISFKSLR